MPGKAKQTPAGRGIPEQARSWLSEDVLLYFGDSLNDAGNVLRYGSPEPSQLVLGEAVGQALGDDPEDVLLSLEEQAPTSFKSSLNFAAWGASTSFGSADPANPNSTDPNDPTRLPLPYDLLSQVDTYQEYLDSTKPKKSVQLDREVGALISIGGNDLLAFVGAYGQGGGNLARQDLLTGFLIQNLVDVTIPSIQAAVTQLDPLTDHIALLAPGNLGLTPYGQFLDGLTGAGGAVVGAFAAATAFLNAELGNLYDDPAADVANVTAVDGVLALNNALAEFLADGYAVEQFWEATPVTGSVHPSTLGSTYLAGSVFDPDTNAYKNSVVGQILHDIPAFVV